MAGSRRVGDDSREELEPANAERSIMSSMFGDRGEGRKVATVLLDMA